MTSLLLLSEMDLNDNPFAKVFPTIEAAQSYALRVKEAGRTIFLHELDAKFDNKLQSKDLIINKLVEEVFNFTVCKNSPSLLSGSETQLLYFEDVSGRGKLTFDELDTLQMLLLERLLLEDPSTNLIGCILTNKSTTLQVHEARHVTETRCFYYLFECYCRLLLKNQTEDSDVKDIVAKMIEYVISNASTALNQPDVYEKQNLHKQVLELFLDGALYTPQLTEFLGEVASRINIDEGPRYLLKAFSPLLSMVQEQLENSNILNDNLSFMAIIYAFASKPLLAQVLLKQVKLNTTYGMGRSFADSALGAGLNISILPMNPYQPFQYFSRPLEDNLKLIEQHLWSSAKAHLESLNGIFMLLLKNCRQETLSWIGDCLDKNRARGRLSALNMFSLDVLNSVSDGFMINLTAVLLNLSQPFMSEATNPKLLKIDPTYPAAKVYEDGSNGVHMASMSTETCLLPTAEGDSRPSAKQFSFISECFYLTHRALTLGLGAARGKAQRLYQDIGMMQARLGPDARNQDMEQSMSRYLTLRCAVLEPSTLALETQFIVATCSWLVQVVLDPDTKGDRESFNPSQFRQLSLPLTADPPPTLRCVPEALLENIYHYLVAAKRFEVTGMTIESLPNMECILSLLLVFMSGSMRAHNPHLRAQLAECLECLLPQEKGDSQLNQLTREQLFLTHPHRSHIVESLLDVFVGIEMTGQSVTFEQKFNYRRPMYTVMEYLWNIKEQRECFKKLAVYAEANMEAVNPPIFLRFLNLLMNDAVFLLDEALSNMAQIRTMTAARDEGEWENLPQNERQRNETSLVHIGMTARFDNILGTKTIDSLVYLSSEIKSIFCHPTMVDRIAAMLNYFLLHLVGPNKKNFKVKDQLKEYMFDPASIVMNICRIYIQLSDSEEFCAAVSRDGRSYSPQLFSLAEDVLIRIGGGMYLADLQTVAEKVNRLAEQQKQEDEILAEVPDEYLDPIMSTLMTDPVILPSSRQIVDRSTISRHLLSDQSDPFNREPLTMDMVTPAVELKQQIEAWIKQRHNQAL